MEVRDASELMSRVPPAGDKVRVAQLHPAASADRSLVAVDLVELGPGASTPPGSRAEEQVVFVLSGAGEVSAGSAGGGTAARLAANSVVRIGHNETHSFRNTGRDALRLLVVTPLVVWSPRALGVGAAPQKEAGPRAAGAASEKAEAPVPEPPPARAQQPPPARAVAAAGPAPEKPADPIPAAPQEGEAPLPDISGLLKRGSEMPPGPRPERRRPAPVPEQAEQAEHLEEQPQEDEEEEAQSSLMELQAVFDGGSRGNPGQGYGSFMVQSGNRKPVIKRLEFGDNYTNNQAEYDTLVRCLEYIIERLEVTNRSPQQVALDIKTDSDLVVNQVLGNFKVKDAGLRKRHTQVLGLLERFGEWQLTWHPREETVKLLGH